MPLTVLAGTRPRLIAFDLDDTLAPSKSPLEPRMAGVLARVLERAEVCVISGGQFEQFRTQVVERLPASDALERLHLMPTCGTQYYRHEGEWRQIYAEELSPEARDAAFTALETEAKRLGLWAEETWGPALEDRGTQVTYSALGQAAPVDAKKAWDPTGEKKAALRDAVAPLLPELEVRSGGSTSIDITRRGIDKAYGMRRLAEMTGIPIEQMHFVGDRLDEHGNDYPVLALGIAATAVSSWEETVDLLEGWLAEVPPAAAETAEA